tara:strand:+ start:356 stop:709 length:354 start_codon:yes stop_codon:yes gene_type:complete
MAVLAQLGREITAVAMLLSTAHHTPVVVEAAQAQSEQMAVVQTVVQVAQERHLQSQVVLLHVLVVGVAATITEELVVLAAQVEAATAKTTAMLGVVDQPTRVGAVEVAQTATMVVLA